MHVLNVLLTSITLGASATFAWHLGDIWVARQRLTQPMPASQTSLILDASAYRDPDFDFQLAVPAGWQPIVAIPENHDEEDGLLVAHTVTFEAPREGVDDEFSDYVMIEIVPGSRSGQFVTDGSRVERVVINGLTGTRESLRVDQHQVGNTNLDLVVHQAEIRALGYTVGFFAIGEPRNRQLIDDAFDLMIRTFEFTLPPYRVS